MEGFGWDCRGKTKVCSTYSSVPMKFQYFENDLGTDLKCPVDPSSRSQKRHQPGEGQIGSRPMRRVPPTSVTKTSHCRLLDRWKAPMEWIPWKHRVQSMILICGPSEMSFSQAMITCHQSPTTSYSTPLGGPNPRKVPVLICYTMISLLRILVSPDPHSYKTVE